MSDTRKIAVCPHCGNRAPQTLLLEQEYSGIGWADDGEADSIPSCYYVSRCETCSEILLYHGIATGTGEWLMETPLVWPETSLDSSVPNVVANIYREAERIKQVAPNAYAVQIRRALEAVSKDRGSTKKTLAERLKDLADKGEIPMALIEATDMLRLLGNIGAHASDMTVHPLQVLALDDFFRAVVEYIYVSPSKISKFRESLAKLNQE